MSWYAVRALDEALSETRSLLLPFDLGVWVRLALVAMFAGLSAPQTPTFSWEAPPPATWEAAPTTWGAVDPAITPAVLWVTAAVLMVGVVYALVGAAMEFVLVDALRSRSVRILGPLRDHFGKGVRLFGFRIVVILAVLAAVALVAVPAVLAVVTENPLWLLALVATVPLLFVTGLLAAVAMEFTTAFVVPLMLAHDTGVLAGWRRLWPTLREEWTQFAVYALVKTVLLVAVSIVTGFALAVVLVPLALLVGTAGFVGAFTLANVTTPVLVAVIAAAVAALVALAAVSVPVVTYLTYHSLSTLDASGAPFEIR